MINIKYCFVIAAFFSAFNAAVGQEIESLTVKSEKASVGSPVGVDLNITFSATGGNYCGLELSYGDGSVETLSVKKNDSKSVLLNLSHVYISPGKYTIVIDGKYYFRGLYSAPGCAGKSKSFVINVTDDLVEKQKEDDKNKLITLNAKEVDLLRKEKELQEMQLRIIEARDLELQRKEAEIQERMEKINRLDNEQKLKIDLIERAEKSIKRQQKSPEKPITPPAISSVNIQTVVPARITPNDSTLDSKPVNNKGYKAIDGF